MNEKTNNCDHLIGSMSREELYLSELQMRLNTTQQYQISLKQFKLLNGKVLTPKEILDNRRGFVSRFTYCPYCGIKLNWKEITNTITDNK